MKKRILFILASVVLSIASFALAHEDVKTFPSCKYCGMNREKFAYSRTLVTYDDGTLFGACSIHCLAIDLVVNIDKAPARIEVGDYNSKQLIDAEKALWVIGGSKPGVMTRQGQWAFSQKEEAEAFIKDNGGALATFDEVMKAAYESMYTDTKRIREKRKLRKLGHN
jgi:nitrous oxide reductase accessory protein NosL